MITFIERIFADRHRGTAVRQTDGTDIPVPFEPATEVPAERKSNRYVDEVPGYGLHDDPGHPLGITGIPPERYMIVEDHYGELYMIPVSSRDAWMYQDYNTSFFDGGGFLGATHIDSIEKWTFERPEKLP